MVLGLDSGASDLDKLKIQGYDVFTSVDSLLSYIDRQEEGAESDPETEAEPGTMTPLPIAGTLEHEFAAEMRSIYDRGRQEANYTAAHLLTMLTDLRPLTTAQKLLNAPAVSDGFAALCERPCPGHCRRDMPGSSA